MPPHCDTLDGPVVTATTRALETGNVNLILPYAPEKAEDEIKKAFQRTLAVRKLGKERLYRTRKLLGLKSCQRAGFALRLIRKHGMPLFIHDPAARI